MTTAGRSVSIGLIATELVINARRHAFPDPLSKGCIRAGHQSAQAAWGLMVADDGVGMEADEETPVRGMGTGIVNALAVNLSATVQITSAHPGTLVSIVHH